MTMAFVSSKRNSGKSKLQSKQKAVLVNLYFKKFVWLKDNFVAFLFFFFFFDESSGLGKKNFVY